MTAAQTRIVVGRSPLLAPRTALDEDERRLLDLDAKIRKARGKISTMETRARQVHVGFADHAAALCTCGGQKVARQIVELAVAVFARYYAEKDPLARLGMAAVVEAVIDGLGPDLRQCPRCSGKGWAGAHVCSNCRGHGVLERTP